MAEAGVARCLDREAGRSGVGGGALILQQEVWGPVLHPLTVCPGEPPSAKSYPHCARRQCALHIATQTGSEIGDTTHSASQRGKWRQRGTCLESHGQEMTVLGTGTGARPRGSGACIPTPLLSRVLGTGIAEIQGSRLALRDVPGGWNTDRVCDTH